MEILLSPKATNANVWSNRWRSFWQNLVYRGCLTLFWSSPIVNFRYNFRLYVRSSGGNTTASSSCSNEDPESAGGCVCGRRLTTPVQFCTSPPMDVHRPRRKPWTPPPPKVFHVMASSHSASFDLTQEEDDEIVDIENRARPRQAAFMPGKLKTMFIQFWFSKKAIKFEKISHMIWRLLNECQIKWTLRIQQDPARLLLYGVSLKTCSYCLLGHLTLY